MLLASNRKFPATYLGAAVLCICYRPRRTRVCARACICTRVWPASFYSAIGWRLGLQLVTAAVFTTFLLGTCYRSASLYHPQRRAILHLKNQKRKIKDKNRHDDRPPFLDFTTLRSKTVRILLASTGISAFGINTPIFYLVTSVVCYLHSLTVVNGVRCGLGGVRNFRTRYTTSETNGFYAPKRIPFFNRERSHAGSDILDPDVTQVPQRDSKSTVEFALKNTYFHFKTTFDLLLLDPIIYWVVFFIHLHLSVLKFVI